MAPNYDAHSVSAAVKRLETAALPPHLLVDASHGNSGKDHRKQPVVLADLTARIGEGDRAVAGVMLESFLTEGRQDLELGRPDLLRYGQSITDSCLSFDTTAELLCLLAAAVDRRHTLVSTAPGVSCHDDSEYAR